MVRLNFNIKYYINNDIRSNNANDNNLQNPNNPTPTNFFINQNYSPIISQLDCKYKSIL